MYVYNIYIIAPPVLEETARRLEVQLHSQEELLAQPLKRTSAEVLGLNVKSLLCF